MYTPKKPKEKVENPKYPKINLNDFEQNNDGTVTLPKEKKIIRQLDVWMYAHNFPEGWKREIKEILKPVLQ